MWSWSTATSCMSELAPACTTRPSTPDNKPRSRFAPPSKESRISSPSLPIAPGCRVHCRRRFRRQRQRCARGDLIFILRFGTMSRGRAGGAARFQSQHTTSVSASCPDAQRCYTVGVRASGLQPVTSLTSTPDGDLFVVEAGRSVRLVDGHGALDSVALVAAEGRRITDVAVGPNFASDRSRLCRRHPSEQWDHSGLLDRAVSLRASAHG